MEQTFEALTYVCLKVKGKLVWTGKQYGNTGGQTLGLPVTENKLPSDGVNIRGPITYGFSSTLLTRLSENQKYYSKDSRDFNSFDQIRVHAYSELNKSSRNTEHQNINLIFNISPTFPKTLQSYLKRELEEGAALWNPVFKETIDVSVHLITEKDREYVKNNTWLEASTQGILNRFDSGNERSFIAGGTALSDWYRSHKYQIYLATKSDFSSTYASNEWPNVAKHEFFHIVQQYSLLKSGRPLPESEDGFTKLFPIHFLEGSANTIGFLTGFRNIGWSSDAIDWNLWQRLRSESSWKIIRSESDAKLLITATENRIPESAFNLSYTIGSLMYEWLIGTYGLERFNQFLNSISTVDSFNSALQLAYGINQDDFYNKTAAYIYKNITRIKPYN